MRLEQNAELRALQRGDITLIERIDPGVPPGYELPRGWLGHEIPDHPRRREAPHS
jgi:hypothetical protein